MMKITNYIYEHSLYYLAFRDSLTGCLNRNYFEKKFFKKICNKDCYIVFVDINNLKTINDNFGHLEGDDLIKKIAKILKTYDKNTMRIGGDEFVLTLKSEKEKDLFEDNFLFENNFSYGIEHKLKCDNIKVAVVSADTKMLKAKKLAKRCKNTKNK